MPKFVIEREMPKVGELSSVDLQSASKRSRGVMQDLGDIHWVHSYVTDDKIYCVYVAKDAETVRKHAAAAGLPANKISQVRSQVDASTGD